MRNYLLISLSLLFFGCEVVIEDLDGSILITPKDSSVIPDMDSMVIPPVDSSTHDHDTGMDSAVVVDAIVPMDVSHIHDTSPMDVVVIPDSAHNHDAMTTGINVNAIPVGDPGFSTRRISSTAEQIVTGNDVGAFRTDCLVTHFNFDDPIVYPGQKDASHLHMFLGNTGTDAFSTAESIANSGNSTCRGGILNRTAYWVPALIDANGTPLMPTYVQFYYKSGYAGVRAEDIVPFPAGLKIIAGYKDRPEENAKWNCLDNYRNPTDTIQSCPAGDTILLVITFPQCSDGRLDSPDHRSHMAYGTGNGCPSTHPIPLTQITFNLGWSVNNISGLRLSSDIMLNTAPGVSAHGDWYNGWDQALSTQWTKSCVNTYGDCKSHLVGQGQMIY